jgi:dephospho-CoA kinase
MIVIGVTGGIGTGKSEVSKILEELGAVVIDADKVGHSIYLPDTPGWQEIIEAFGEDLMGEDRHIDRSKLGPIVFGNPEALATLNAITHPKIRQRLIELTEENRGGGSKAVAIEAAILIEAGWVDIVDEVWVTAAQSETAVDRVSKRNNMPPEQVRARIESQMPQDERLKHATVVVTNDGDLGSLREQLNKLWTERIQ